MEYNNQTKEIFIDKELNNLDKFALDFTKIVEKHVSYVIVAGYVSILLGRTRITEDIDMFIEKILEDKFFMLYEDLERNGFWCLNTDRKEEAYDYLKSRIAIRFAKQGLSIPNFEVKFPKDSLDEEVFRDFVIVILPEGKLKISSLERNIAFKRYFLGSDKDNDDARHVEDLFGDKIDYGKINEIKMFIERRKRGIV